MTPFLQLVADDLRQKTGGDMSRVAVIFPNKRASLFFDDYLAPKNPANLPIWAPRYMTINELFGSLADCTLADPIDAVCRIYDIYVKLTGAEMPIDAFYGWGERLLADFDDVDKNMADVDRLFRNLSDIKELESREFLTEEQERVLQEFFKDFSLKNNSEVRERFRKLWDSLHDIYTTLNTELLHDGVAYEGALFRRVVEGLEQGRISLDPSVDQYVVVGFNVLGQAEERLLAFLKRESKTLFYWDYDTFYAAKGTVFEAGEFLRRNLERFPNELPEEYFSNILKDKHIEMVSASTETIQVQSIPQWLRENLTAEERQTAVVLCNEMMLQPVLHALPPEVREVNVTKGFPLSHTNAMTLVEKTFAEWERRTEPMSVEDMLTRLSTLVAEAARELTEREDFSTQSFESVLQGEACYVTYTLMGRLLSIARCGRLQVNVSTLHRIVRQIMRGSSVPFHGEPAVGLQVMGVLETRCLDFENLLMLSVNEGVLPKLSADNSFIPLLLRKAYGLTTPWHRTAVYAYYFYRLLQRARRIRLVYNSSTDGLVVGEMSRFLTQLLVETPLPVQHLALTGKRAVPMCMPEAVEKPDDLPKRLPSLSPSAINSYLRCQLEFYFQYVLKIKEPPPAPDDIQANTLGTLFHAAAEYVYRDLTADGDTMITGVKLSPFVAEGEVADQLLLSYVDRAAKDNEVLPDLVTRDVLRTYLKQLLRHDMRIAPFELRATEMKAKMQIDVPYGDGVLPITVGGIIDRLDVVTLEGQRFLRVVDYKTGGNVEKAGDLDDLFVPRKDRPHYMLQTFIYSLMLAPNEKLPIAPALFFVQKAAGADYSPYLNLGGKPVLDFQPLAEEFSDRLREVLREIYDPSTIFSPTEINSVCRENCKYRSLCFRPVRK